MARRGITAQIDEAELEKLCAMQATDEELASFFGVTTRTIERKRKSPKFAAIMERGKAKGRLSLRRAQFRLLEQGNATMGVWLGKQYLGQKDQLYHDVTGPQIQIVCPAGQVSPAVSLEPDAVTIDISRAGSDSVPMLPAGKSPHGA